MKKSYKLKLVIVGFAVFTHGCSKEDTSTPEIEESVELSHEQLLESSEGSACCIVGPVKVTADSQVEYSYGTNIPNANTISWEVVSGDIEIVGETTSSIVVLRFSASFTQGKVMALGSNSDVGCGETITITTE